MRKAAIFLGGPQGSGKTTAAEFLAGMLLLNDWHVEVIKFADPIYRIAEGIENSLAPVVGRRPSVKDNSGILQDIGDIGRERYDQKLWITLAKLRAEAVVKSCEASGASCCVIFEDVRKKGELDLATELELQGFEGFSVYFEASEETRKARLGSKYRANTSHSTETEVQEFKANFAHTVSTDTVQTSKEAHLAKIVKDRGFCLQPSKQLADIVEAFNHHYSQWSQTNKFGANFEFAYEPTTGMKSLKVRDCEPVETLPEDVIAVKLQDAATILSSFEPAQATPQV